MEKMPFLSTTNICFYDEQISWSNREGERERERERERESIFEFNNILIMVEKDVVLINTVKATLLQHKLPVTIVLHTQNKKCCPKHFVKELF